MRRALGRWWSRLVGTLPSARADRDLAEELETHIQMLAEDNLRRGMTRDEAWRLARSHAAAERH